jgi:hypothetical protein
MFKSTAWKVVSGYIMTTATYGAVRAIPGVLNKKKSYYNDDIHGVQQKDMLLTEKLAVVMDTGRYSVLCWPSLLFEDFRTLELILTGKNQRHYGNLKID